MQKFDMIFFPKVFFNTITTYNWQLYIAMPCSLVLISPLFQAPELPLVFMVTRAESFALIPTIVMIHKNVTVKSVTIEMCWREDVIHFYPWQTKRNFLA